MTEADGNMKVVMSTLARKVHETLAPNGPSPASVLEWAVSQPPDVIKRVLIWTQPKGWDVAIAPLVESLTHDQRVGLLVALVAVYVQAQ